MMQRVLVTGASGFVGSAVVERLAVEGRQLPIAGCRRSISVSSGAELVITPSLGSKADWSRALQGVAAVVHTAARAHVMDESAAESLAEYRQINVEGTLALARQAAQAGVQRFVFVSSIGVNGHKSSTPFTENHTPQPADLYAHSKLEAEKELKKLAKETGMELVIIRPPLVYGPSAPGNFRLLTKVANKGLPLPLAGIRNQRSFISVWNLTDFIVHCLSHPKAAGNTFVVADGEVVSTSDLLRKVAHAAGKPSRLFWLPASLLKLGAKVIGKDGIYNRLFDSLQVDASHARQTLDWVPPLSLDEGLKRCFYPQK